MADDRLIGEPGEKLQITLLDMAHRFERVRQQYESFIKSVSEGRTDALDRKREMSRILTGVNIILNQCIGFARNRGIEESFRDDLKEIVANAAKIPNRVKRFSYLFLRMTTTAESFLESHKLLYYAADIFIDPTEEIKSRAIEAGRREYIAKVNKSLESSEPSPLAPPEPPKTTPEPEPLAPPEIPAPGRLSRKFDELMKGSSP